MRAGMRKWSRAATSISAGVPTKSSKACASARCFVPCTIAIASTTRGVPLDGIGFQAHVSLKFDDPAKLESFAKNLDRFAKLGLELHITELDIRLSDSSAESLSAQAKLYGEITTACVRQPACKLLQTWGFTDKHSWIPQFYKGQGWALLWDEKYQKKPAYEAIRSALVH